MIDRSRTAKSKNHSIQSNLLQRKLSFANLLVQDESIQSPIAETNVSAGLLTPDTSAKWNTHSPPDHNKMVIDTNSPILTQAGNRPCDHESAMSVDFKFPSPVTPVSTPLARHSACPSFLSMYDIRQVQLPVTPQKRLHRRNSYSCESKQLERKPSYASKIAERSLIKRKLRRIPEEGPGKPGTPMFGESTTKDGLEDLFMQPPAALSQSYINTPAGSPSLFNTQNDGLSQSYSQFTHPLTFPQHGYYADFHERNLLGSGHFGKVYAVERRLDGLQFAVKQVQEVDSFTAGRARRGQEICTMGMASKGMHVVQLHHAWTEGEGSKQTIFIMMELCTGGNLQNHLNQRIHSSTNHQLSEPIRPFFDELQVTDALGQLALALYSCHSRKIAHCDFKLENILYDSSGRLKLADFGLAVFLDPTTHQPTPFHGRPESEAMNQSQRTDLLASLPQDDGDARYISLDMLNERRHYREGDVFSLGMCMYELMSGESLPKNGQEYTDLRTTDLVSRRLRAKHAFREPLVNIVCQMIAADPTHRPNITEILRDGIFQDIKREILCSQSAFTEARISFLKTVSEIEFISFDIRGN
ncbi:serine/threonine-protein kinase [Perkinsela sp. CCAP 1560/4]|nr:serine/threonine-protein kinase [Perkinsela sp. CCAP 1560/4]|eukprot:KNH03633.1 serine/threonine-protein kinase [Perkinsela sp. CCAP 1560/4]